MIIGINSKQALTRFIAVGLISCLISGCGSEPDAETQSSNPTLEPSSSATEPEALFPFEFSLVDVNGQPVSSESLKGKVVIVDFWGTWCPPCRKEIPHFVALHQKYNKDGLEIVGLNYERTTPDKAVALVQGYIKESQIPYQCALIDRDVLDLVPDLEGFPTTLFLDREGRVRIREVGYHPFEELEERVKSLLDETQVSNATADDSAKL